MMRSDSGFGGLARGSCALGLVCGALVVTACAGRQKGKVVEKTLDAMSAEQRHGAFDTTAAVLDRNPEMVDEFYAVARQHPEMLHRILANATRDLREPPLAWETAKLLVANPASLRQVMRATLELSEHDPEAREVLAQVMVEERAIVADILADHPRALRKTMRATVSELLDELVE